MDNQAIYSVEAVVIAESRILNKCEAIFDKSTDFVWLYFGGMIHHIKDSNVFDKLFCHQPIFINCKIDQSFTQGHDLESGTCLIKDDAESKFYLCAFYDNSIRLYHIQDFETFSHLQLNESQCLSIPEKIVKCLEKGQLISLY